MTYAKSGTSSSGGRLFKSASATSLALAALTGGVMLSSHEVKASTTTCTPFPMANTPIINPLGQSCTTFDPALPGGPATYTNNARVESLSPGFPSGTLINLEGTGLNYPLSQQQIDTDFNTSPGGGGGNYTGGLISSVYRVTATLGYPLNGIDLAASGIGGFTVKKEVFSDAALTTKLTELNLTGAGFVPVVPLDNLSQIYIRDTYNNPVIGQSSIDNVQNTVRSTPGPLPILGASAAFGFSRKLRGRIKASRAA